jgi:hypothetical protein
MDLAPHRFGQEILADPQFPAACNALIDAMLALYEHEPFLSRLLLEAGRNVVFTVITCLHARHDESDLATWPTWRLLTQEMAGFAAISLDSGALHVQWCV